MGLLEQAAVEAAKKLAENEESHTDTRGIVKASKVFPVLADLQPFSLIFPEPSSFCAVALVMLLPILSK